MKELVTLERLKELMTYDPETGIFTRNIDRRRHKKGTQVGSVAKSGYLQTIINGNYYYLHRLAYFYMTGEWPPKYIDHIDMNKQNNAWSNLRPVTHQQNAFNNAAMGFVKTGPLSWLAAIRCGEERINLGTYSCPLLARLAYVDAKQEFHKI